MSTTTTNFGLLKPQLTDPSDITQTNQNWDIIDEKLKTLEDADVTANANAIPTDHASSEQKYGVGNFYEYGHLKLSDATNSNSLASDGVAATPRAVKEAYDCATSKAPAHTYGTADLTAGTSPLATGTLYLVYE